MTAIIFNAEQSLKNSCPSIEQIKAVAGVALVMKNAEESVKSGKRVTMDDLVKRADAQGVGSGKLMRGYGEQVVNNKWINNKIPLNNFNDAKNKLLNKLGVDDITKSTKIKLENSMKELGIEFEPGALVKKKLDLNTQYEFETAIALKNQGYKRVVIVKEKSLKTADIMLEHNGKHMFVEVKRSTSGTVSDAINHNVYREGFIKRTKNIDYQGKPMMVSLDATQVNGATQKTVLDEMNGWLLTNDKKLEIGDRVMVKTNYANINFKYDGIQWKIF